MNAGHAFFNLSYTSSWRLCPDQLTKLKKSQEIVTLEEKLSAKSSVSSSMGPFLLPLLTVLGT
jgi:hypothetical protein